MAQRLRCPSDRSYVSYKNPNTHGKRNKKNITKNQSLKKKTHKSFSTRIFEDSLTNQYKVALEDQKCSCFAEPMNFGIGFVAGDWCFVCVV